jgi:hypothetical protein
MIVRGQAIQNASEREHLSPWAEASRHRQPSLATEPWRVRV